MLFNHLVKKINDTKYSGSVSIHKGTMRALVQTLPMSKFSNISLSLAQKDNCLCSSWIIYSGTTDNLTSCSRLFSTHTPCQRTKKNQNCQWVIVGNFWDQIHSDTPPIILHGFLCFSKLSCNLFSLIK